MFKGICEVNHSENVASPHKDDLNYDPMSLPHNGAAPLGTIHLHRTSHSQTNATVSKQRRVRFRVNAKIEVEVRAVLIRSREAGLRAQRVALRRAQIIDHDDDTVACVAESVAGAVGLDGEFPTRATAGPSAGAL